MRKHISEVKICKINHNSLCEITRDSCESYHRDDFCLLCGYELEGDRLYMEIHGSDGAINRTMYIDSSQPYACMECVCQFEATPFYRGIGFATPKFLISFIKDIKR